MSLQSGTGDARAKEEVRTALQGVSEWFDDYLAGEQGDGLEQVQPPMENIRFLGACQLPARSCHT